MVTPHTLAAWLKEQALPLALIVLVIVAGTLLVRIAARRRREALLRERDGITEQTFTAHLQRYGFDPEITSATYRYLQEVHGVAFPILPSDALDEDLGLDTEEVRQSLRELTERLGRHPSPGLRSTPLLTVEDLVRLLQASPRKAQVRSSASAAA